MAPSVPADGTERVRLSDHSAPFVHLVLPFVIGGILTCFGILAWRAGAVSTGAVLIALPLLVVLVWWRWGTRLYRVVATPAGFVVSRRRREWLVPFEAVASTRWGYERSSPVLIVALREPVAGLRSFAFVGTRSEAEHPIVQHVGRWRDRAQCVECGSPVLPGAWPVANLCAECAHVLYGYPPCPHAFGPRGACILCGWDRSRSDSTSTKCEGAQAASSGFSAPH